MSEVYKIKVPTPDALLTLILDAAAHSSDKQQAIFTIISFPFNKFTI
jgi:hypothetical protein